MRQIVLAALVAVAVAGCGGKMKRLTSAEQDHYRALRVYMDDRQEKAFLKGKTEEDRDQWLKDAGLWDRFYKYDAGIRELIVSGDVSEGWTEDMLLMSWGPPFQRRRTTGRPASRSEIFIYRFEVAKDGTVRVYDPHGKTAYKMNDQYQLDVYVDDQKITEILRKEDWE